MVPLVNFEQHITRIQSNSGERQDLANVGRVRSVQDVEVDDSIDSVRKQAARLFALAIDARDKGDVSLANLMTEAATRCLDHAEELDLSTAPPPSAQQQQPVGQQQQQIQPDKDKSQK